MRRILLVAAMAACLNVLAATPAVAADATLSGTLPRATGPSAKALRPTVRALRFLPKLDDRAVVAKANGSWSLRAGKGLWMVIGTTWTRRGPRHTYRLVRVGSSTVRVPLAARRAEPTAPGPRVSVGKIPGPDGYDTSSLFATELIEQADDRGSPCAYAVVVDPSDSGYVGVMKELSLRASKYVSAADRAQVPKVIKTLTANRPGLRLTGTVSQVGGYESGPAKGTFTLTDARTGRVVWSDTVEANGLDDLAKLVTRNAAAAACKLPPALIGTVEGDQTAPQLHYVWSGSAAFVLAGWKETPQAFIVEYDLVEWKISDFTATLDGGQCVGTAKYSGSPPANGGLRIRLLDEGVREYSIFAGWNGPTTGMNWVGKDCPAPTPFQSTGMFATGPVGPGGVDTWLPWFGFPLAGNVPTDSVPAAWHYVTKFRLEAED